jgi:intracellular septation protein
MSDLSNAVPLKRKLPPGLKLALNIVPMGAFFIALYRYDIFVATAALIVTTVISAIITYVKIKRLPIELMIMLPFLIVFGGLTLYLHDEAFIKIKVTIVYLLFAGALLGGLLFGKSFIGLFLEEAISLDDAGWRILTIRWGLFFLAMAGLNEIVRLSVDTQMWGYFKVPGTPIITFLFAISQMRLIQKHALPEPAVTQDAAE